MRGATGETVVIRGLTELVRDFRRLSGGGRGSLGAEVKRELREVAKPVARLASAIAEAKGLHASGALAGSIKPFATASGAGIRENAMRPATNGKRGGRNTGPFAYPNIYEYGGRLGGSSTGPRAWMAPAAEQSAPMVEGRLGDMIDRLTAG